ncbi:MAG: transcriptional regulator, LacI family, partial [Firmicutes bacterium]|nr:transcriptional regulator, LacI family [Bacillota bacterium]
MKNSTATIKDVARKAGVSIATVSRILNGSGVVSSKLMENVQSAIKEIGYQPNAVARALKIKESKSIGLIIPDIENPFFPALVRGVEDTARKHDYAVILCNSDGYAVEEKRYIRFLHSK